MAQDFFSRLRGYYLKVAEVLEGKADAANVFPNPSDTGGAREQVYAEFLRQHAPSKCNVFLGGFLFQDDGYESRQLDVIVTTDTAPLFHFHNPDGGGKSFSPVEGTLGVASIKSTLDKQQLFDALCGIASIPPTKSLDGRVSPILKIQNYDDWPYKIIYANNGLKGETILQHVVDFYVGHPKIPVGRRPHIIHVAGKYAIFRAIDGMNLMSAHSEQKNVLEIGSYVLITRDPDLHAMVWVLYSLQKNAFASTGILFDYSDLINKVLKGT